MPISRLYLPVLFIVLSVFQPLQADITNEQSDPLLFDDTLLDEELVYPDWFNLSFGDLRDDLESALVNEKQGIIVYFGQKRCAYCSQFINTSLEQDDIRNYLRKNYDIVPLNIWGINDIIDTDGTSYTEREFSVHYKTNFTPALVFYNKEGKPVFRLRGYYPPYKFGAALKYVAEEFYKDETFRDYLERAEPGTFFTTGGLNERSFFQQPPYDLQNLARNSESPLVIFFEQGNCHACDLLHTGPLNEDNTLAEINKMNAVQLDMWSDTAIIKPDGEKTTARQWAKELGIFYSPSLVFFDPEGNEIFRLDSVVKFYRLWGVLDYINRKGYTTEPDYQAWRLKQRKLKPEE